MSESNILEKLHVPNDWGVEQRARTLADFKGTIWPALVVIALIVVTVLVLLDGKALIGLNPNADEGEAGLGLILLAMGVLYASAFLMYRFNVAGTKAGDEAVLQAQQKIKEWQDETLIPILEAKHGVKIILSEEDSLLDNFEAVHPENGRVEVRVQGVNWNRLFAPVHSCHSLMTRPPIPRFNEEPWLEEVIHPPTISFRKMALVSK